MALESGQPIPYLNGLIFSFCDLFIFQAFCVKLTYFSNPKILETKKKCWKDSFYNSPAFGKGQGSNEDPFANCQNAWFSSCKMM